MPARTLGNVSHPAREHTAALPAHGEDADLDDTAGGIRTFRQTEFHAETSPKTGRLRSRQPCSAAMTRWRRPNQKRSQPVGFETTSA
jgi:hypothetical protein